MRTFQLSTRTMPILLLLLVGCAGGSGGGGWPTQSYPYACETGMLPDEPICLTSASFDGGFKYRDQFRACRIDMQSFENALNEHYRCTNRKLKWVFDELLVSVPATYNCYVDFFSDKEEGDPTNQCPPIDVPTFFQSYEVSGLEHDLGVPLCIRKSVGYNFAPKWKFQLVDCKNQVEVFTSKNAIGHSVNAESAQEQYDNYMQNLRFKLDQMLDDAVRKFNCFADGDDFCI